MLIMYIVFACVCALDLVSGFLNIDPVFSEARQVGVISSSLIEEASGLAASRKHPGALYAHNDKGDSSRVYAISTDNAHLLAELDINHAANYDWEDIAVGICPHNRNHTCMYIGDTGDHSGDGSRKNIYVVPEPDNIENQHLNPSVVLHYKWNQSDTETLMVDPAGNVILISKVHGGQAAIGKIPASAFLSTQTYHIIDMAKIRIPHTSHQDPTGGDISVNGDEVLIRTHSDIYYWQVANNDYLGTLSTNNPVHIHDHKEHQPEAIAWDMRGDNFYTCSEGQDEPLYHYIRL